MPQALRHLLWIALAAGTVLFTNLGVPALWDEDEPKNAECAREMLARGDWIVPTFNEELRTDKPILLYWLMIGAYRVFGVTEFAARFWSAVFGCGTVLATYRLGRLMFSPQVGLLAGVALCTALMYGAVARAATPDSTLIFFTTLSLLAFVEGVAERRARDNDNTACLPDQWRYFALMYLAMGLAVLAKGPVGLVLPSAVIGLFLLCAGVGRQDALASEHSRPGRWWRRLASTFAPQRVARVIWLVRPLTGAVIVAAVALPWYIAVGIETDGRWLTGFLGNHNVGRFMRPMEGHRGPIFFYIPAICAGFFPWSVFLPASIAQAVGHIRRGVATHWGHLFVVCWAGMYVGFFSLASTKLPNYVLPCYPALALVTAALLVQWAQRPDSIKRWVPRVALAIVAIVGLGMVIGLTIAAYLLLPGDEWLGLIGAVPLIGAGVAAWYLRQQHAVRVLQTFAVMSVALATGLLGVASTRVSRHQNSPAMAAVAREISPAARRIATFEYYAPSLVFYAQQRVPECRSPDEVRTLFAGPEPGFLVIRPDNMEKLADALPDDVTVLARQRRFLRKGDLVLLGRAGNAAQERR